MTPLFDSRPVLVVLMLAACHGSVPGDRTDTDQSGDDASDTDVTQADATIGPAGGTIRVDGAELVVPVGALDHEVDITLTRLAAQPPDA